MGAGPGVAAARCDNAPMRAQDTLFSDEASAAAPGAPLAERLRPQTLDDVVGQRHLLAPGRPLRVAFDSGRLPSMILWGPPGVGKTTLARLLARATGAHFIALSAVLAGVKDIRDAVEQAETMRRAGRATVVFVDEVHRFNKSQQDAFLPHVESGLFTFVGATTENPSFEVNSALLSRAGVHVLEPWTRPTSAPCSTARRRCPARRRWTPRRASASSSTPTAMPAGCSTPLKTWPARTPAPRCWASPSSKPRWARCCGGATRAATSSTTRFRRCTSRCGAPTPTLRCTGWRACSTPAWMPRYAARRLVRMASEDIGLADPRALRLALDAAEVYERLGSPEGELALAEAVVYLAVAPKSNAVYKAWNAVREIVAARRHAAGAARTCAMRRRG